MTYLPLIAYAAGIVCLVGELTKPYRARHRATGLSTMERVAEAILVQLVDARLAEPTYPMEQVRAEIFGDEAPLCPPMYPPVGPREGYAHRLGAGRYAHLGLEELDATNDRLIALRLRASVPPVVEVGDEMYERAAA